jgi:hypothetical protein
MAVISYQLVIGAVGKSCFFAKYKAQHVCGRIVASKIIDRFEFCFNNSCRSNLNHEFNVGLFKIIMQFTAFNSSSYNMELAANVLAQ